MTFPDLQPMMANAPWAVVLIICVPSLVILLIVCICVLSVSKDKRVEAMKACAEVIRATKPGKSKPSESKPEASESKPEDSDGLEPSP